MSRSSDRIAPGTRSTLHGIDVVAVNHTDAAAGCRVGNAVCPFRDQEECGSTGCDGVIWLTVPDYTAHRLTR